MSAEPRSTSPPCGAWNAGSWLLCLPVCQGNRKRQELPQRTQNQGRMKASRAGQGHGGYHVLGSESRPPQPLLTALLGSPSPPPGAFHGTPAEEPQGAASAAEALAGRRETGLCTQFGRLIVLSTTVVKGLPLPKPHIPASVKWGQQRLFRGLGVRKQGGTGGCPQCKLYNC